MTLNLSVGEWVGELLRWKLRTFFHCGKLAIKVKPSSRFFREKFFSSAVLLVLNFEIFRRHPNDPTKSKILHLRKFIVTKYFERRRLRFVFCEKKKKGKFKSIESFVDQSFLPLIDHSIFSGVLCLILS